MSKMVPEGWAKIKLGDVGKFSTSSVDKKSVEGEQEVSLLNYMDVYNHSTLTEKYQFQKVTAPRKQISTSYVQRGDVFFTPSSETPDDIGHSAVFIGDLENIVHSYHTVRFRASSNEHLDDNFKSYGFKGAATYEYFRKRATGSTRFTVSLPVFNELELTVPPLPEQKKIASILTSVDEVIEKTQSQINKLQDLKKGTMNELLTKGIGHTEFKDSELGRIPKSWEVRQVSDLVRQSKEKGRDNLPIYSVPIEGGMVNRNTQDRRIPSELEDTSNLFVKEGNLAYNMMRMWQGASGIAPEDCLVSPAYVVCEPTDLIESSYLGYLLKEAGSIQKLHSYSQGITGDRLRLYFEHFCEIRFPIPPLPEQRNISSVISQIDAALNQKNNKLHQTQSLKKSLMQDLLTGKVRVSVN